MFRILVVDSEPNVLRHFQTWLRSETLEIETAQTGQQGLELAGHFRPDALILDYHLHDMEGLALLDRLRDLDARLPVTLVTAYAAAAETAVAAMKRGAVDWLLKPVECLPLRAALQRALQRCRFQPVPVVFRDSVPNKDGGPPVAQAPAGPVPHSALAAATSAFASVPSQAWLAGLMNFTRDMLREEQVDIYRSISLEMDRIVLGTVLHHVKGNQVKASEILGISRTTLRAKLRSLNLAGQPTHEV